MWLKYALFHQVCSGRGQEKYTEQWGQNAPQNCSKFKRAFLVLLQMSDFYQRFYLNKGVQIAKMHLAALVYVPKRQPITTTGQAKGRSVINSLEHNSTIRPIRQPPYISQLRCFLFNSLPIHPTFFKLYPQIKNWSQAWLSKSINPALRRLIG